VTTARGKFITVEGMDGAGKSSHLKFLAEALGRRAPGIVMTREPGGTEFAERLRQILLAQSMDPLAETLLMFAARSDHVRLVIRPALMAGNWVLCDRYSDATYAYQGGGKGVSMQLIRVLADSVHADVMPDRTFVFDCSFDIAHERLSRSGRALDRFETEGSAFFGRVRQTYLEIAKAEPQRVTLIDATLDPVGVQAGLEAALRSLEGT